MEWLKQMFTGKDNLTVDFVRVAGIAALFTFLGLSVASFITGKPWDGTAFGAGFGIAVASTAAALKVKETTEPDAAPIDKAQ